MGLESFNSSSDTWITGGWLVAILGRFPRTPPKSSVVPAAEPHAGAKLQTGKQWKFVACIEMMNPRQVPNLLFTSTLLTCVYTFIDHLIRGTDCPMNDLAFHFSPPEVLFHSPSVCSIYLYLALYSLECFRDQSPFHSRLKIKHFQHPIKTLQSC